MTESPYLARLKEIDAAGHDPFTTLRLNFQATVDETFVQILSQPRDQWAVALREADMPRSAALIEQLND
jgi:hypothetical protein